MSILAETRAADPASVPLRRTLLVSTIVSSLGGFLFGYDNIVISGAIGHLAAYFHLEASAVGWAAGCALIGCLIGSASAGGFADKFGLRKALYGCAACFALSALGVWASATFRQYVVWRILGGVGIGAASILAPMYIAEIAPARLRGRLVVFYQFGIVVGILCAVFVNMLIENSGTQTWNMTRGWRWMFAASAVPAAFFLVSITFARESPRWLMKKDRQEEASRVLEEIEGPASAKFDIRAIQDSLAEESGHIRELLTGPYRKALVIGFILAALTQASGITALLSFLPELFRSAGARNADAFLQSVLVGLVNLALTCVALWLVDRAGRRTLTLWGTALQTIALLTIGTLYLVKGPPVATLLGIMVFVAGHAVGNGAVCWVIISEIFPNKVRGIAMSIATSAIWISAYLANQFLPVMQHRIGFDNTFFVFAAFALADFAFVLAFVPETKGCSLEDISRIWTTPKRTRVVY